VRVLVLGAGGKTGGAVVQQAQAARLRQERVQAQAVLTDLERFCERVRHRLHAATFAERAWLPALLSAIAAGTVMTLFTWVIAASEDVEKALANATEQLKRDFTDEALEEQQRLIVTQRGLRERLASLAGTE